jgi:hypothetical protein
LLGRKALGAAGWYVAGGAQAERFYFSGDAAILRQLQDYTAVRALQYFKDDQEAAALTVRPGWFFARHAVAGAWDCPVDVISGVPLAHDVNGVIGVRKARFDRHPVPIFGLIVPVWTEVQLQLVFPEPALIYEANSCVPWRLRGERSWAGFLVDSRTGCSVVEYSTCPLGVEFRHSGRSGRGFAL